MEPWKVKKNLWSTALPAAMNGHALSVAKLTVEVYGKEKISASDASAFSF